MSSRDLVGNPNQNDGDDASIDREERLGQILADYADRMNAGEHIEVEDVLEAYPDLAADLAIALDGLAALQPEISDNRNAPLGTLGDYTLRRQIGRGGMGVVYEAWENSMNRGVALKVLPAGVAADSKALTRFVREAQVAGDLHHPNVVSVYGMGLKEKTPYYAMEFVDGETLSEISAKIKDAEREAETPFGPKDQVDYFVKLARAFADVADGLQHAHSKGVIHRDIKPSNLILDREGRLRILDFGLARLEGQDSLTMSGDLVGTPLYMSPEQARQRKVKIDHRTDIYSLGATMYETLTGRPPFRGKNHQDTLSQIIERDPVELQRVNSRVSKDLETIVQKCLRKDPGDRYGTAEALEQDLRRFVRGDPIEARVQPRWERLFSRMRRHRVALYALATVVVVGCVIAWLGSALWQARHDASQADLKRQIKAQLDEGRWTAAIELGRKAIQAGDRDVEAYELLGAALKHSLSGMQSTADKDSLLELYTVARRFWKLAPEDTNARYLLRAVRETANLRASGLQPFESSPGIASALAEVTTLFPARHDRGVAIVEDFAADSDLWDGRPLAWLRTDFCPGEAESSRQGDGLDVRSIGNSSFLFVTDEVFSGEVSVTARATLHGTPDGMLALVIHGGPDVTSYCARLNLRGNDSRGSHVELKKWRSGETPWSVVEKTRLSIAEGEEVQLELCSTRESVEFRVWRPGLGEERPEAANATMDDCENRVGNVGFAGFVPKEKALNGAAIRFRSFSVIARS